MTDHSATPTVNSDQDAAGFERMTVQLRRLLDAMAAATPDPELVDAATDDLSALADWFTEQAAPTSDQVTGRLAGIPGRGQALVPVFRVDRADDHRVGGTVRFGRYHHGSDGTAHGGAIALFLEEVLGYLAVSGRSRSLTASLQLDYRSATLVDRDLRVDAWFEREEGRKRFLRATLHDGEALCVEAKALCVALRAAV
ncbi:PaaI family thioesterase [Pseudonocardia sp. NPDC049154]|uniref:PaaI family thioesterase n=1 Tax=Pseudonocardia sp. NPDC049154 TaxID=3155501 RepID=UPI003404FF62